MSKAPKTPKLRGRPRGVQKPKQLHTEPNMTVDNFDNQPPHRYVNNPEFASYVKNLLGQINSKNKASDENIQETGEAEGIDQVKDNLTPYFPPVHSREAVSSQNTPAGEENMFNSPAANRRNELNQFQQQIEHEEVEEEEITMTLKNEGTSDNRTMNSELVNRVSSHHYVHQQGTLVTTNGFDPLVFSSKYLFDEKEGLKISKDLINKNIEISAKTCNKIDVNKPLEQAENASSHEIRDLWLVLSATIVQVNRLILFRQSIATRYSGNLEDGYLYVFNRSLGSEVDESVTMIPTGYKFTFSSQLEYSLSNAKQGETLSKLVPKLVRSAMRKAIDDEKLLIATTIQTPDSSCSTLHWPLPEQIIIKMHEVIEAGCRIDHEPDEERDIKEMLIKTKARESVYACLNTNRKDLKKQLGSDEYEEILKTAMEKLQEAHDTLN